MSPARPVAGRIVVRRFFGLSRDFWRGPTGKLAWFLTTAVFALVLLNLAVNFGINRWNKFFFDALEQRNAGSVLFGVGLILGLAFASAAVAVCLVHVRMRLQVRWRQWLGERLIARWLAERRFYQLTIVGGEGANPEFRIADDVRLATEPLVDFSIGLANAFLSSATFLGVLWAVGGALGVGGVTIPGFMVWAAILYALLTSAGMLLVGRPLVQRVEEKNAGEAGFRYELTRVRDSAENIALIGGDEEERARLGATLADVASRWIKVVVQQARMTWISNGNAVLAPVIPLLLCAPKYLEGELTLGSLMQIAAAFTQVQIALNWLVENAIRIAEWAASAQRVVELTDALDRLDATIGKRGSSETIDLGFSDDGCLHLKELSIAQQDGTVMLEGADVTIAPGDKVLIKGGSGSGKSTLIRAMAGLWPWGSGEILRPEEARVAFMPQRPYLPLGSLRDALLYSNPDRQVADERIVEVLKLVGLAHLAPRLHETEQWTLILSAGEQQRLAFARLFLGPPEIVIMDGATSALDEVSEGRMMELLGEELQDATVLNVAHRPGLEEHHDREIHLLRESGRPATARQRRYSGLRRSSARLLRERTN